MNGTNFKKWLARTIVGAGAIATMYFTTHGWDTEESIATVGWAVGAATSYLVPADNKGGA